MDKEQEHKKQFFFNDVNDKKKFLDKNSLKQFLTDDFYKNDDLDLLNPKNTKTNEHLLLQILKNNDFLSFYNYSNNQYGLLSIQNIFERMSVEELSKIKDDNNNNIFYYYCNSDFVLKNLFSENELSNKILITFKKFISSDEMFFNKNYFNQTLFNTKIKNNLHYSNYFNLFINSKTLPNIMKGLDLNEKIDLNSNKILVDLFIECIYQNYKTNPVSSEILDFFFNSALLNKSANLDIIKKFIDFNIDYTTNFKNNYLKYCMDNVLIFDLNLLDTSSIKSDDFLNYLIKLLNKDSRYLNSIINLDINKEQFFEKIILNSNIKLNIDLLNSHFIDNKQKNELFTLIKDKLDFNFTYNFLNIIENKKDVLNIIEKTLLNHVETNNLITFLYDNGYSIEENHQLYIKLFMKKGYKYHTGEIFNKLLSFNFDSIIEINTTPLFSHFNKDSLFDSLEIIENNINLGNYKKVKQFLDFLLTDIEGWNKNNKDFNKKLDKLVDKIHNKIEKFEPKKGIFSKFTNLFDNDNTNNNKLLLEEKRKKIQNHNIKKEYTSISILLTKIEDSSLSCNTNNISLIMKNDLYNKEIDKDKIEIFNQLCENTLKSLEIFLSLTATKALNIEQQNNLNKDIINMINFLDEKSKNLLLDNTEELLNTINVLKTSNLNIGKSL